MERTPLFADMAPLGSLPPTRLRLKIKGDVRAEKAESLPPSDAAMGTPEGTTPVELRSSEPEPQPQEAVKEEKKAVKEETETANQEPVDAPMSEAPPIPTAMMPHLRSPVVQQNGTPTPAHSRNSSSSKSIKPSPQQQVQAPAGEHRDERMNKIVRKAIEMAREQGQEKLAAVITKFYEETFTNAAHAILFDAVITKTETDAQKIQFQKEMKRIRKLVKRESREGSRSRTMSGSAHPPTIPTMGGTTIGQQPPPMGSHLPHLHTRPAYSPSQSGQISPSPFSAFRGVTQPSPLSPTTQSHPASPSYPPSQVPQPLQDRSSAASAPTQAPSQPLQRSIHQDKPVPAPVQNIPEPAIQTNNTLPPPQSTPKAISHPPISTMAVSTRRSARATASDAASNGPNSSAQAFPIPAYPAQSDQPEKKASNTSVKSADAEATTNGVKESTEKVANLNVKPLPKQAGKSPKSSKTRRTHRSASIESNSSLSSVDEDVVEKGAPTAHALAVPESQAPSRAVSRSATPRPGAFPKTKAKPKGSNLKNLAGTKRGASETIAIEDYDEETRERHDKAKDNFEKELQARKSEQPPEPDFTSYRESDEYLGALPETAAARSKRTGRRQSAPDTSRLSSTRTSTSTAPPASSFVPETGRASRGTRKSTQNQRLQVDVMATAPRLEIQTPSTPQEPPSDAESNGDPPPKRRKMARTKYSPVKLPNGVAPTRQGSPSRSSPALDGARPGKRPNRDQCFACGCGGELICCDMCQNSFHAECWDPPCTDASDEPFRGFEWVCTHCRIFDKRKENEERSKKGEPLLIDTSDEESDMEMDDDVPTTPPDWTLVDAMPTKVPLFSQLRKTFKELLPEQYGLKPMVRDVYDGYVIDTERRFRPTPKAPITVDSRVKPIDVLFDEGKQIKDPKELKQCTYCGLSAVSKKGDLIKCDTCGDFWHTDCLPTPTTAPPQTWSAVEKRGNRSTDVFKKRYWECPRHIDQDIVLLTDPIYYRGNRKLKRGIKVRLPRKQVAQVAALKAGFPQPQASHTRNVREAPDDVMHINVEVDDSWWESYDTRKNELKETDNASYTLHENNILADFAAKAMAYVSLGSIHLEMYTDTDDLDLEFSSRRAMMSLLAPWCRTLTKPRTSRSNGASVLQLKLTPKCRKKSKLP